MWSAVRTYLLVILVPLHGQQSDITYDAYYVHFHNVSVYLYEGVKLENIPSVMRCAEECYYKKDRCNAFEYHQDQQCVTHRIIEFNGSYVSSIYIKNVQSIPVPDICYSEIFAEEVIKALGLNPCPMDTIVKYSRLTRKCYMQWTYFYNYWNLLTACKTASNNPLIVMTPVVIKYKDQYNEIMDNFKHRKPMATWLSRNSVNSPWYWGNGAPLNFTNWAPGQPSNAGNCMMVNLNSTWSTYDCDSEQPIAGVCESNAYLQP